MIADLRLSVDLDPAALLAQPAGLMKMLRTAPMAGHFSIPRRKIASFSTLPFVKEGSIPVEGEVRVDAYMAGTIQKPAVVVRALGWGLAHTAALAATPESADWKLPVDLDTLATYDSEKGTLEAHVSKSSREIITAKAEVLAKLEDLLAGKPKDPKRRLWTGSIEAKLHDAPLGEVPFLAKNSVGGHLSGSIAIRGLNDKPSVAIDLELPDLRLGQDLFFETGRISVHIDPSKGAGAPGGFSSPNTGIAKIDLVAQDGGSLKLVGYAGM
jgi:translocation and assembly module TamB